MKIVQRTEIAVIGAGPAGIAAALAASRAGAAVTLVDEYGVTKMLMRTDFDRYATKAGNPLPVRFANVDQIMVAARSSGEIPAALQEIGMMMAKVDARDRSHRAEARHRAGQAMCRNADPHAALDNR